MNTLQTDTAIVTAILWVVAIAVVAYDRIKYRKYYTSKSKLVVLRTNNAAVREYLSQNGIKLCQCAYYNTNRYLYSIEGDHICGFTESARI